MTIYSKTGNLIAAGTTSEGIPRQVSTSEMQRWMTETERFLAMVLTAGGALFATKAAMDAALNYKANTPAIVVGDTTPANNGIYRKVGASGTGSWTRVGNVPWGGIITLDNAGAGTGNAIVATSSLPMPTDEATALFILNITHTNTAGVTIAINGLAAVDMLQNNGDALPASFLTADSYCLLVYDGADFRVLFGSASIPNFLKQAVNLASTANISLTGSQTVDGTSSGNGLRILAKDQTTQTQNGVYTSNSGGAWSRSTDADAGSEIINSEYLVLAGTANAGSKYRNTNTSTITVGVTNITYQQSEIALDPDLLAIATLVPANDDIIQRKSGAWANRTMAQLKVDLGIGGGALTSDVDGGITTALFSITKRTDIAIPLAVGSDNWEVPPSDWVLPDTSEETVTPGAFTTMELLTFDAVGLGVSAKMRGTPRLNLQPFDAEYNAIMAYGQSHNGSAYAAIPALTDINHEVVGEYPVFMIGDSTRPESNVPPTFLPCGTDQYNDLIGTNDNSGSFVTEAMLIAWAASGWDNIPDIEIQTTYRGEAAVVAYCYQIADLVARSQNKLPSEITQKFVALNVSVTDSLIADLSIGHTYRAGGFQDKTGVACVAVTNIALTAEQTIDTVLTSASRVLVMGQTDQTQNGIYVSAAGAWARSTDMDAAAEFPGARVQVLGGTNTYANKYFVCSLTSNPTLGVTPITIVDAGTNYLRMVSGIATNKSEADALVKTSVHARNIFLQGEADRLGNTDTYEAALVDLFDKQFADVQILLQGQVEDKEVKRPPVFLHAASKRWAAVAPPTSAAALRLSKQNKHFVAVAPYYQWWDAIEVGDDHLSANGYRAHGCKIAQVDYIVTVLGQGWQPTHCVRKYRRGNQAALVYHVPFGALQFQNAFNGMTIDLPADKGYSASDASGALVVQEVELPTGTTNVVLITFDRDVVGSLTINYADDVNAGGRGNVCDQDPFVPLFKYELGTYTRDWEGEGDVAAQVGLPYPMFNFAWPEQIIISEGI